MSVQMGRGLWRPGAEGSTPPKGRLPGFGCAAGWGRKGGEWRELPRGPERELILTTAGQTQLTIEPIPTNSILTTLPLS